MNPRLVVLLLAMSTASCGGDGTNTPTAPTLEPSVQIAGTWSGTYEETGSTPGATGATFAVIMPLTMSLNQSGSNISGSWAGAPLTGIIGGTVSGTVDSASFTGTITYTFTLGDGRTCQGSFSGSSTVNRLTWSSPEVTGGCFSESPASPPPVKGRFELQRR